MMDCPYCGQPLDDDDDSAQCDSPRGCAHEACYTEWLDDEDGRAADNAFDLAGDR